MRSIFAFSIFSLNNFDFLFIVYKINKFSKSESLFTNVAGFKC